MWNFLAIIDEICRHLVNLSDRFERSRVFYGPINVDKNATPLSTTSTSQSAFTCSKLTIETLEQGVNV